MGTRDTPRPSETERDRIIRLEERHKSSERRADERHGQVLHACQEATEAAREASASVAEVGRNVAGLTSTIRRIDDRLRNVELRDTGPRAAIPMAYREVQTQPIDVSPPEDPHQWIHRQRLKQGAQVGGVVAVLTALFELARWFLMGG